MGLRGMLARGEESMAEGHERELSEVGGRGKGWDDDRVGQHRCYLGDPQLHTHGDTRKG